jgi:hypothetical protein
VKLKLNAVWWRARVSAWTRVRVGVCEARNDKSRGGKKKVLHGLVLSLLEKHFVDWIGRTNRERLFD